jgi:hypothetical protein
MFKHYIFTRWNLLNANTTIYNNPAVENPEEWMEHRMKLFDELTLPSVMCQTNRDFRWLLAFALETPRRIIDKYADFPGVIPIYDYPADFIKYHYKKRPGEWIITSRLDNDDVILPEYIETVQSYFDKTFKLVDVNGYQYDLATKKHYDPDRAGCTSPFISLIEQVGTPWQSIATDPKEAKLITEPVKTVYYCSHSKMEWHFPSVKSHKRLYKMVVHDRNISNKITGYEIL